MKYIPPACCNEVTEQSTKGNELYVLFYKDQHNINSSHVYITLQITRIAHESPEQKLFSQNVI